MISYILTDRIHRKIAQNNRDAFFIANRRLSRREIGFVRQYGLKKFYLPQMDASQSHDFYKKFDKFWDELIGSFPEDHIFWRNAVSSKMQEWDKSIAYFVLVLWTLKSINSKSNFKLVFLCETCEEIEIFSAWATQQRFQLVNGFSPRCLWIKQITQEFWNLVRFFYVLLSCMKKKLAAARNRKISAAIGSDPTLIVSQFYTHSIRNGHYQDPFFGNLYRTFLDKNKKFMILGDLIDLPIASTKNDLQACQSINLFYIYSLIGWRKLLQISLRMLFPRFRVRSCAFEGCDLSALVSWHARRFNYSFNVNAELFFEAVTQIGHQVPLKRMLIVFEDNVFERACIQAFKRFSPKGIIEGYSHAVIYPLNLKLHLTEYEKQKKPQCDRYITCGDYASRLLSEIGNRSPESVISACALRSIPVFKPEELKNNRKDSILIALDGFYSVDQQLDWLLENKDALRGFRVVLRAHPNVSWEYILRRIVCAVPEEFEISKKDLKEDFARSFCVVYRQASVGLQAMLNGIPAVHMQIDLPLPGDPIEELKQLKWTIHSAEELRQALSNIKEISPLKREDARIKAVQFAEKYFNPPTESKISYFLD